jgi:serine/threonine protein kinase/tetratricopeptide (TPR) repeat protein
VTLAPGTRLGGYEVLALLGSGGMGDVYRARDPRLQREVAVKVLADHLVGDLAALARFEREARAVAALAHPGIVAIHDLGEEGGTRFAVMELLEGETLRARLTRGPPPRRRALEVAVALADALAAAHEKGIVHRDLKPENVFLTDAGPVKVLDFGLARELARAAVDTSAPTHPALTELGSILGTLGYMAPEQLQGAVVDHRADIFSLGCVLYEMLAGQPAFPGRTKAAVAGAVMRDEPPPPSSRGGGGSPALDRVVARCLAKDPEERFQSTRDLAFDLRAILEEAPASRRATATPSDVRSVAVLPFENVGGSADDEYLSDGLTESVLFSLSGERGLRVMARATVFRYKGRDLDPQTAGRDLGVDAVLTGRLRQRGERIRVDAELVDVEGGWLLWGERYDRRVHDLLSIQDEIATEIASKLRSRLGGDDEDEAARRPTENTEAYQLYLRGRHSWNRRTADGFRRAVEFFQSATELDPTYALAYAGMADSFALLERYGVLPPADVMPRAKAAAQRALENDPELAEAHASLAIIATYYDWDWPAAEGGFRRALTLKPGYPTAHHWFAFLLAAMERHAEAWEEIQRARDLDPLSPIINTNVGTLLYFAGRFDEAVQELRRTLAVEPDFAVAHQWLGRALEQAREPEDAIPEHRRALELLGDPESIASLAHALAKAGRADEARAAFDDLDELSKERYVPSYWRALVHTGLGDEDGAFRCLASAVDERFDWLIFLRVEPAFRGLRADARFGEVLRRVGFPDLPVG